MHIGILAVVLPFIGILMACTVWRTRPDYIGSTAPPHFRRMLDGLYAILSIGTIAVMTFGSAWTYSAADTSDLPYLLLTALPTIIVLSSWAVAHWALAETPHLSRRQRFEAATMFAAFLAVAVSIAHMTMAGWPDTWTSYAIVQFGIVGGALSAMQIAGRTSSSARHRTRWSSIVTSVAERRTNTNLVLTS